MRRFRRPAVRRLHLARIILVAAGALLVIAAGLLRFVIVPAAAQLPADVDTTLIMTGRLTTLDPEALDRGDLQHAIIRDAPSRLDWRVRSAGVQGDAELLADTQILTSPPSPREIARVELTYAVNRKTLYGTRAITGPGITNPVGLTESFPIPTEQRDYLGWVDDAERTTTLPFRGEEEHAGLLTYRFIADIRALPITDRRVLDQFPTSLPKAVLPVAASLLGASPQLQAQLRAALPKLPDNVALTYTYTEYTDFWVEPTTGVVVDLNRHEMRSVVLPLPGSPQLAVYDNRYAPTAASVADQRDEAADGRDEIMLLGSTVPLMLAISGGVLVAVAAWLVLRARRRRSGSGPDTGSPNNGLPPQRVPPEEGHPSGGRTAAERA
jgi:Porin PorA